MEDFLLYDKRADIILTLSHDFRFASVYRNHFEADKDCAGLCSFPVEIPLLGITSSSTQFYQNFLQGKDGEDGLPHWKTVARALFA